jgi:DNA primase
MSKAESYMDDRKPDLIEVMEQAGVEMPVRGDRANVMVRCPFHNDTGRPNMSISLHAGLFHCFRCGRGGDVYDFEGLLIYGDAWNNRNSEMFKEVLRRFEVLDVPIVDVKPPPPPNELTRGVAQVLALAHRVYHLSLMSETGVEARDYLRSRRIDVSAMRKYRIGYVSQGALYGALAGYPPGLREGSEVAGLFVRNDRDELREWLIQRIVFPDVSRNGTVRHMIGRSLDRSASLKYLSLGGLPKTIWGLGDVSRNKPVILTESIIDAVNLRQMGLQGAAVNGTGIAGYLLPELRKVPMLVLLPQNDPAGREAVARWKEKLPNARTLEHPFSETEKDLNDQVVACGMERTTKLVRQSLTEAGVEVEVD